MPDFNVQSLISWFHFIALVMAGGSMPVCLMISGFEDTREDIRGVSAVIWKKVTVWGMRCAVFCGVVLFVIIWWNGGKPFVYPHFMFKIGLAPILVLLCEITPKSLGVGKRGTAILTMMLFLLTSFVASNYKAFLRKTDVPAYSAVETQVTPLFEI